MSPDPKVLAWQGGQAGRLLMNRAFQPIHEAICKWHFPRSAEWSLQTWFSISLSGAVSPVQSDSKQV